MKRFYLLWGVVWLLVGCGGQPVLTPTAVSSPALPAPSATVASVTTTTAANADVLFVRAVQDAAGSWTFQVTVTHPDTGWDDYADGWDVLLPDGTILKPDPNSPFTRLLTHPHETEQPFTRSQGGLIVPEGTDAVRVRAHDLLDGFGGQEIVLDWTGVAAETAVSTAQYEVIPYTGE
ncbi:MAG: hypothetical protein R3E31_09775 [Chloroflexota bacterium]|nr:hypothetical protein [Ardenticatenaceae bacterium]